MVIAEAAKTAGLPASPTKREVGVAIVFGGYTYWLNEISEAVKVHGLASEQIGLEILRDHFDVSHDE
jgi:hypothetical protein